MTNPTPRCGGPERPGDYEIRIRGHVGDAPDERFAGWTVSRETDGATRLTAHAVDQAALHGILKRVRDLGVPLLSLVRIDPLVPDPDASASHEDEAANRGRARHADFPASEEDPRV